jgi:PAS domain S-box-containing protein
MKTNVKKPVKRHMHYITEIEALIASIGEGLVATDDTGQVTRVNQPALNIFGYRKSELLHHRFTDKVIAVYENGKPLNVIDTPIAKSFLTGQVVSERVIYKRKDGTLTPVQVTVSPLLINGKPVGAVQLFRDIRGEIQMDKMKSDFISLASHQLRTPLSSVNIYAGMLVDGLGGALNKEQQAFTRTIIDAGRRMNELIDTLLNITRIEAGGIEVSPSDIEIHNLISEIITTVKPSIESKKMALRFDSIDKEPLAVKTDPLLVKEVLINLLTNAIKYTPEKGSIDISLLRGSKNIIISIKDSGYGIPAHSQGRVFTKFFRADNILLHDVSGTGLGLYLTKMIAESLSGDLWFESIENKGSTFYFSLPSDGSIPRQGTFRLVN